MKTDQALISAPLRKCVPVGLVQSLLMFTHVTKLLQFSYAKVWFFFING